MEIPKLKNIFLDYLKMLTHSSLPSSTEATKSFRSDHGKEEFLCDWKCLKCYTRRRNNYVDNSCYSQNLSTVGSSTISENSTTPFLVYQRKKKPQRNITSTKSTIKDEEHRLVSIEDDRQKDVVVNDCYVNDSCSSSVVVDDNGEKDGVGNGRKRSCSSSSSSDSSSCLRSCKVCDRIETTLKMLICDQCEEAFHVSCCYPRVKKIPGDEWLCSSCAKNKQKNLKEASINIITNSTLSPIELMTRDKRRYRSTVRVGDEFQAVVPDWSGPILDLDGVYDIGELLRMTPSECRSSQDCSTSKPSGISYIGNWLQCCAIIDGVGESVNGTICGKWRRAPLFEVQTDSWECFSSFIWDPTHSDCAVPQELETEQVLKQLKYIEMLRPRLAAKRRKLEHKKRVASKEPANSVRYNTQTTL